MFFFLISIVQFSVSVKAVHHSNKYHTQVIKCIVVPNVNVSNAFGLIYSVSHYNPMLVSTHNLLNSRA